MLHQSGMDIGHMLEIKQNQLEGGKHDYMLCANLDKTNHAVIAPLTIKKKNSVDKGSGQILETCTASDEPIILTADAAAVYVDFSGKGNLTAEGFQVAPFEAKMSRLKYFRIDFFILNSIPNSEPVLPFLR